MVSGFQNVHTDISTWVVPLGGLFLLFGGIAGAIYYKVLIQHWVGGILAIACAAASMPVATAIYNYFHS